MDHLDYTEIRNLVDRYSFGVSTRDQAMIASVFAKDGVWRVAEPFDVEVKGNTAIAGAIEQSLNEYEFVFQMPTAVVIDVVEDQASAQCLMHEVARSKDGKSGLTMLGIYTDKLVRTGTGWRFSERVFQPRLVDDAPPQGKILG